MPRRAPERVGTVYSDGRELHIVPVGDAWTICGEWAVGEPPLSLDVDAALPTCTECEAGVIAWRSPSRL